jgi:phosphonate transport system substrate-binding protein
MSRARSVAGLAAGAWLAPGGAAALLLTFGALGAPGGALAQDCPRGALEKRYCDRDGDLVADAPADAKDLADPQTLIFSYTPVEDPEVYRKVWDGLIEHLAKLTGRKVQFFAVQSNAAQIEAMRAGRLHVAGFSTGTTPLGVNCAGFVPFAMMASKKGEFGYEMEIIVHRDSPIKAVPDIKGKTLAFTAPTSNSGYKAPVALLQQDFGMAPEKDYTPAFSGKHDNSILGVVNKDYDAGAVANSVLNRMIGRKVVDAEKLRRIYKSQTFPTSSYGYVHNLKPELVAKVKEAFFTYAWEGSPLLKEFEKNEPPGESFMPIDYKQHWDVVRKIDAATNVNYACK